MNKLVIRKLIVLLVSLIAAPSIVSVTASEVLQIEWFSNPTLPGQTLLIHAHPVEGRTCSVKYSCTNKNFECSESTFDSEGVQVGNNSIKAIIPESLELDVYHVEIHCTLDDQESVGRLQVNLPDPWWLQGDEGNTATIGGWLRVFGNSLSLLNVDTLEKEGPTTISNKNKGVISTQTGVNAFPSSQTTLESLEEFVVKGEYEEAISILQRRIDIRNRDQNKFTRTKIRACKWWGNNQKPETICDEPLFELSSNSSFEDAARSAWFNIPKGIDPKVQDIELGIWVSNGRGKGNSEWVPVSSFVSPEFPYGYPVVVKSTSSFNAPSLRLSVADFGSCSGTPTCNSTIAIEAAFSRLRKEGGGTLYFPAGQYFLSGIHAGALRIPANSTLLGESRDKVALYFEEKPVNEAPSAHISFGNCDGTYVIQDLSFYISSYYHSVLNWPQKCTNGLKVQRVAFHANAYLALQVIPQVTQYRGRAANFQFNTLGPLALLKGMNYEFSDNYIESTWNVFWSDSPGNAFGLIRRNEIIAGGAMHWFDQVKQMIFEHNHHFGSALVSYGSNIDTYSPNGYAQNIYMAHNSMRHVTGNDREVLTLDNNYAYIGATTASLVHGHQIVLSSWPTSRSGKAMAGGAVYVITGPGAGAYRRVVGGNKDNSTLFLESPFEIPPVANQSVLNIAPFRGRILVDSFSYTNGGAAQLYGYGVDVVLSNLRMRQCSGIFSWGRIGEGGNQAAPNFRVQFTNNTIEEGNMPQVAPLPRAIDVTNYAHLAVFSKDKDNTESPLNRFVVLRNNRVLSNAAILVDGYSADVVVEHSVIESSYARKVVNTVNEEFRHTILIRRNNCDGNPCQGDMKLENP